MLLSFKNILALLLIWVSGSVVLGQNMLFDHIDMTSQTLFYAEATEGVYLDKVLEQPFVAFPHTNWMKNSHTNADLQVWLIFTVDNPSSDDTIRFLFFPGIHGLTKLYEKDGQVLKERAEGGIYRRATLLRGQFGSHTLPIVVLPKASATFLVSIKNYFKMYDHVRADLYSPMAYRSYVWGNTNRQLPYFLCLGFTIGGLVVLMFFGLFQFLITRSRSYLWYAFFALVNTLNFVRVLELSLDITVLSGVLPVFKSYFAILPAATTFCYLKFMWHFLDFDTTKHREKKWLEWCIRASSGVLLIACIVGLLLYFFKIPIKLAFIWFRFMHFFVYMLGVVIVLILVRLKKILGWFVAVGVALMTIGGILSTSIEWGSEQKPLQEIAFPDDPKVPLCIFILLESLCLALGLGYKTKLLEREIYEAIQDKEYERQRIAQDLHDELGSEISGLGLGAFSAARSGDNGKMVVMLETVSASSINMVEHIRDLIWFLMPENRNLEKMLIRLRYNTS